MRVPGLRGTLQAVNAGMPAEHFLKPGSRRPFFRHHQIGADALRATAATNALDHEADLAKVQE